jgi:hypothetical protein
MRKFVIQKVGLSTILAWMLLGGAFVAAISGMITLAYNLTARLFGGIEIELREEIPTVVPLDGAVQTAPTKAPSRPSGFAPGRHSLG